MNALLRQHECAAYKDLSTEEWFPPCLLKNKKIKFPSQFVRKEAVAFLTAGLPQLSSENFDDFLVEVSAAWLNLPDTLSHWAYKEALLVGFLSVRELMCGLSTRIVSLC